MSLSRAYLAGPDVFLPDVVATADAKKVLCRRYGFEGVFPLDAELGLAGLPKQGRGLRISEANESLIRGCHLVIANMTPFRGPSLDVGTAYEIGFARALGLPIFGYSNGQASYVDRVAAWTRDECVRRGKEPSAVGGLRDVDGMAVEDFDLTDNLMIDAAVRRSAGTVVVVPAADAGRFTSLEAFESCLRLAQAKLGL